MTRTFILLVFYLLIHLPIEAQQDCLDRLERSLVRVDSLFDATNQDLLPQIKQNLQLADSCGNTYHQAWAIESEAYYYFNRSELPKAVKRYKDALELYQQDGDSAAINFCMAQLGDAYSNMGLSNKAIDQYLKVLPWFKTQKDTYNLGVTYHNISLLYYDESAMDNARAYNRKVLSLVKENPNYPLLRADALATRGDFKSDEGKLKTADSLYRHALSIYKNNGNDLVGKSQTLSSISYIKYLRDQLDSAIHLNQQAIQLGSQFDDAFIMGSASIWQAHLYLEKGDTLKAKAYLRAADTNIAKTNSLHLKYDLVAAKSELAAASGNYRLAYQLAQEGHELNDSLNTQNVEQKVAQYELEREEIRNQKAQQLNKQRQQQLRQKNYFLAGAGVLIIALLLLAWLTYKNHQKSKQLNRTKDYIISVIGHDLRTPVYQIRELLAMAKENPENQEQVLTMARESSSNLVKSFDNLVHWAKSQLSGIKINAEKLELREAVAEEVEFFKITLDKKQLKIEMENLDGKYTYFDPTHLKIILRNLLNNAIKFSDEGSTICFRVKDDRDCWQLEVEDHGAGMSPALVTTILEDKPRKSLLGTHKEKGTGMGMSLVKNFVEANHASLTIDSEQGKGSIFRIVLPKAD